MSAPSKVYVMWDRGGLVLTDTSLEEILSYYVTGDPDEHIYEYSLVREHPINVDMQQDPEGEQE